MNYMLQPIRPEFNPWKFISIWLMLTGFALCFDFQTTTFFKNHQNLTPIMTFCDFMGGYSIHCLVLAVILAISPKWRTVIEYVAAMSIPAIVCAIIKFAVGRARPYLHLGILPICSIPVRHERHGLIPLGPGHSGHGSCHPAKHLFP